MNVAIIGAGRQGFRRAKAIAECGDNVVLAVDNNESNAKKLAGEFNCKWDSTWKSAVTDLSADAVVICTPNDTHSDIAIAALGAGKHVLCEKPIARNIKEGKAILEASITSNAKFKSGFNHRYHPAVMKAKKMLDSGQLGKILFMRCRYGITGRSGYDKDWRMNASISGGGQLMDQGQHVLDLFRWFGGDISEVTGYVDTLYWDIPVEDNVFAIMRAKEGHICSMHASWTEWKNIFSFEVFGKEGYVKVEGLGGSYGIEKLISGKRDFNAPFSESVESFDGPDKSFTDEWKDFTMAVKNDRESMGSAADGLAALKLAFAIYSSSNNNQPTKIDG